jgi:hypothetical protein
MDPTSTPASPPGLIGGGRATALGADLALALLLIATVAGTAVAITNSWGSGYWQFDAAMSAVAGLIALARPGREARAAAAGLAVAAVAIVVPLFAELPREPSPAVVLSLSVLIGAAIRTQAPAGAGAVAAAGLAVTVGAWLVDGFRPGAVLQTAGWIVAVILGLWLRRLDHERAAPAGPYF